MDPSCPNRVRFGAFELDLRAGELQKGTRKILLQEQPFQILHMLVEQAGNLVTREEIRHKLWPNDTVVGFDHSIYTAINKLRQALGDSADKPKYIETLIRFTWVFFFFYWGSFRPRERYFFRTAGISLVLIRDLSGTSPIVS